MPKILPLILWISVVVACSARSADDVKPLKTGAENIPIFLPKLQNKRVGVVANHTSLIGKTHLVDSLLALQVNVAQIFSPEHGFRGNEDAGAQIEDGKDSKTGLPIISLHGKNRKPTPKHLEGLDVIVFDIQDVGVRFYTYLSTLFYVMEAAAENHISVIILDRPNPNGDYVAGPVLDLKFRSFVGMVPVPVVHGMTLGELAKMINAEKWLKNGVHCDLTVVQCQGYSHAMSYNLPIKPSPNLPNANSIKLYPSLCFFEPTQVSIGRGTNFPFQVAGYPENDTLLFSFMPVSIPGMSTQPKHEGEKCYGLDFRELGTIPHFTMTYLVDFYKNYPTKDDFFTSESFFNLLAGTDELIGQLKSGMSASEIEASWQTDLEQFKNLRKKYLLYPDFE